MSSKRQSDLEEFESEAPDWYHKYEWWSAYPLFVLGLMFLVAFSIQVLNIQDPVDQTFARIVIPVAWIAFAIDYVIGFTLAQHKWGFVRSHPLQLAALIFPPLRLLLVLHVVTVLQKTASRTDRARTYLLFLTTLIGFVSAILVVFFELRSPDSNIRTLGNAIWWVGETVSTVGYGDYYPVTIGGRIVAGVLFINGVALLSVITAGLAQKFTADTAGSAANTPTSTGAAAPAADSQPTGVATTSAQVTPTTSAAPPSAAPPETPTSETTPPAAQPAPDAGNTSTPATTVTISREALEALQRRIVGLEGELRTVRGHVVTLLGEPPDTPSQSQQ